mgnify:CR=1 FL=1
MQGNAQAMSEVGYCNQNGIGTKKNREECVNWYIAGRANYVNYKARLPQNRT